MKNGKNSWMGFKPDGTHSRLLTGSEQACITLLRQHVGKDQAIPARRLAAEVLGCDETDLRDLRYLINHLIITHSQAIMCIAGSGGGYCMPANPGEVREFYNAFHKRAMTGLVKASRGSKSAFVETMEQLTLLWDEPEGETIIEHLSPAADKDPVPAWVQLVTRFLNHLSADPQRYAAEIESIRNKYGDIFVRKETMQKIKSMADQMQTLLKEVA